MKIKIKVLMVGDYTGKQDETPLEDRKPINVTKEDLSEVMAKQGLGIALYVEDILFFQADDGIRDATVTGVQTCALPISLDDGAAVEIRARPGSPRPFG